MYWDQMVLAATTVSLAASAVGGIMSLTTKAACDTDIDVETCCGNEKPPPLIPIVGLVATLVMPLFLLVKRVFVARGFHMFREHVHRLSANTYDTDQKKEMIAIEVIALIRAVTIKLVKKKSSMSTRDRSTSTVHALAKTGFFQGLFAVGFIVIVFLLLHRDALGSAAAVGGVHGRVGEYYKFTCDSCANVSITCHIPRESAGLWWTIQTALFMNFGGSVIFCHFVWTLMVANPHTRFPYVLGVCQYFPLLGCACECCCLRSSCCKRKEAAKGGYAIVMRTGAIHLIGPKRVPMYVLWRYAQGDKRNLRLDIFMHTFFETVALLESKARIAEILDSLGQDPDSPPLDRNQSQSTDGETDVRTRRRDIAELLRAALNDADDSVVDPNEAQSADRERAVRTNDDDSRSASSPQDRHPARNPARERDSAADVRTRHDVVRVSVV